MDEPFAALDEITRNKLNDDLVALKCELDATVVFVTHSVYESVYLSDRIVVMAPRPGRIVAEIEIPAPLPRDEDFRLTPLYAERCRETSAALHQAMSAGARSAKRVNVAARTAPLSAADAGAGRRAARLGGGGPHQPYRAGHPAARRAWCRRR